MATKDRSHKSTQHNSKQTHVHKITNVPDFYIELILNGFEAGKSITRGIGRGGPWKSRLFLGPPLPMPLVMDLDRLKTIMYRAI